MYRHQGTQNGLVTLFHKNSGSVIGYQIGGTVSGPRAIAVGRRADVGDAFHRLAQLPTLPRLKGVLNLVFEDDIEDPESGLTRDMLFRKPVDGSIYIAFADAHGIRPTEVRRLRENQRKDAYWSVLRLATRLGMIEGRGVVSSGKKAAKQRQSRSFGMPSDFMRVMTVA